MRFLGLIAILFFVQYAGYSYTRGTFSNSLWVCHIGCLFVGLGLLASAPRFNAIGFFLLAVGNVGWILYLIGGGELILPSLFTHFGGFVIGAYGLYRLGIPKYSFLFAILAFAILQLTSRLTTSSSENINLAFRIQEGWESYFSSHFIYLLFLYLLLSTCFFCLEFIGKNIIHKLDRDIVEQEK